MDTFSFDLALSAAECLRYYRGTASTVVVRSREGLTLSLPAVALRRFITSNGVHGRFRVTVNAQRQLVAFERVHTSR